MVHIYRILYESQLISCLSSEKTWCKRWQQSEFAHVDHRSKQHQYR